ncbi:hypothetical protein SCLCIDRAFT_1207055 [Scleroderma citrinum Foug A]|uniref:Uncharacterized protein n=1 Tax=Scleroderma citrinum Foug A TaxID=1036808 RepID=A0A0C3AAR8_9AGAM|nr:hypothetical protein SCLCIDRAFT_1207055 [Scleroderma citrinum Foug A]
MNIGTSPKEVDHILYLERVCGRDKGTAEHRKGNSSENNTDSAGWFSMSASTR